MSARLHANPRPDVAPGAAPSSGAAVEPTVGDRESARAQLSEMLLALQRALEGGGAAAAVERSFGAHAEVVRYGWGAERDVRIETFVGVEAISEWVERTPAGCRFEPGAIDAIDADCLGGSARYRLEVAGFRGGGRWTLRLGVDGRIARLGHHPDSLDPDIQDEVWRPLVEVSLQPIADAFDHVHGPHCRHPSDSAGDRDQV